LSFAATLFVVPTHSKSSLFQRIWPSALIILGVASSVAWAALLGYGLGYGIIELAEMAL